MRRLLTIFLLTVATTAMAHGPHYYGHWARHDHGWNWVAPVIVGGAIGYAMARPQQPIVVQQQTPPVVYQQQNCSPWTQIQQPDGTITMTRTCYGIQ